MSPFYRETGFRDYSSKGVYIKIFLSKGDYENRGLMLNDKVYEPYIARHIHIKITVLERIKSLNNVKFRSLYIKYLWARHVELI